MAGQYRRHSAGGLRFDACEGRSLAQGGRSGSDCQSRASREMRNYGLSERASTPARSKEVAALS